MILEGLFEAVLPAIGRVLGYIVIELFFQVVCYATGFVFLRAVTFGKFPEHYIPKGSSSNQEAYVIVIGITVIVLTILGVAAYHGA